MHALILLIHFLHVWGLQKDIHLLTLTCIIHEIKFIQI